MRLSFKMVLIFSAMMLVALIILSSYATGVSLEGASAFTKARFHNMAVSIARDMDQDFSMMELTLEELTNNSTFMAALNQMLRDDSEDQKMGIAAGKVAILKKDSRGLCRGAAGNPRVCHHFTQLQARSQDVSSVLTPKPTLPSVLNKSVLQPLSELF